MRGRTTRGVSIPLLTPARAHGGAHICPFASRFPRSGLYISVIPPLVLGFAIGALAAIMGIGGGFILIPAMIYLLRMPTHVVVGTSLFQVLIVACSRRRAAIGGDANGGSRAGGVAHAGRRRRRAIRRAHRRWT